MYYLFQNVRPLLRRQESGWKLCTEGGRRKSIVHWILDAGKSGALIEYPFRDCPGMNPVSQDKVGSIRLHDAEVAIGDADGWRR